MPKKTVVSLLLLSLGALLVLVAVELRFFPSDIESKGSDLSLTVQYLALATSVVSLLTAIIGLLKSTKK